MKQIMFNKVQHPPPHSAHVHWPIPNHMEKASCHR
jgi:hypothetical protein